ncbi:hypothetical protein [Paenibacillus larvae]|uniref:hypothetical protein n=1 Tax=Paenibacillus larvae TaxID=1464 RepID=UPI0039FDAB4D
MRRRIRMALLLLSILALAGCGDRIDVEDATLALVYGMELEDDHLNIYEMNPVFNKNAEKKYEVYKVSTDTTRHARPIFNSKMNGQLVTGKLQLLGENPKVGKPFRSGPSNSAAIRTSHLAGFLCFLTQTVWLQKLARNCRMVAKHNEVLVAAEKVDQVQICV